MRKSNKKIIFVLFSLIASAILLTTMQVNALSTVTANDVSYSYDGISAEKAEKITGAMSANSNDDIIQPFNILCILGHSKANGTIVKVEHNYYSTAPRCKDTTYFIEYCTRNDCDYFKVTGESVSRVGCH